MNTKNILKIMPYVLGALILILVGVIIFTQLSNELDSMDGVQEQTAKTANSKNNKTDAKTDEAKTDKKNNVPATDESVTDKSNTQSEGSTRVIGEQPVNTPTPVPEPTKAADPTPLPTEAPKPTATPRPTATPVPAETTEQLILDYVCTPKDDYVHTKNGVNLRLGPDTSTPVVAFLETGVDVHRTGYGDEWTRIVYNGKECYIYTPLVLYVVEDGAVSDTTTTTDGTVDTPPAEIDLGDESDVPAGDAEDEDIPDAEDESTGEFDPDNEVAPDEGDEGRYGDGEDEDEGFDWDEEDEDADFDEDEEDDSEESTRSDYLISIDPGHQAHSNTDTEPIGPDATEMKTKVSSGTASTTTGTAEYVYDLEVALMLRDELVSRGYNVIMTRTSNDVDISNIERAQMANDAGADIAVRIHANSSSDSSVSGVQTICMTSDSPYNADLHDESRYLSDCILHNLIGTTGAKNQYVFETETMTGINWSEIPVTIVETGFMSNPEEDALLMTDSYKKKIVRGIADGIDEYFGM